MENCADDGFGLEAKKVTAVYKRRAKETEAEVRDSSISGLRISAIGKADGIFVFRDEGYVLPICITCVSESGVSEVDDNAKIKCMNPVP